MDSGGLIPRTTLHFGQPQIVDVVAGEWSSQCFSLCASELSSAHP